MCVVGSFHFLLFSVDAASLVSRGVQYSLQSSGSGNRTAVAILQMRSVRPREECITSRVNSRTH